MYGTTKADWLPAITSGIYSYGPAGFTISEILRADVSSRRESKKWMVAQMQHYGHNTYDPKLKVADMQKEFAVWAGRVCLCYPCPPVASFSINRGFQYLGLQ